MVWFAGVLLKPLLTHNGMNMNKVNTKTCKVKEHRDFSKGSTPQERYMENVERGYVTCASSGELVNRNTPHVEVIDGKRYIVMSL